MTIPKILHVCWFGGGVPDQKIIRCQASRDRLLESGYKIFIWNEANYDINKSERVRDAYKAQKWSLVSNYVRLDVLKHYGGIYIDADVEIIRSFDSLLQFDFFIGFIWDCCIGTAVIGSIPHHRITDDILQLYESDRGSFKSPNNDTFTEYFMTHVNEFHLNGHAQTIGGIKILDKYAFEHPSIFYSKNYTIHHFAQSWVSNAAVKKRAKDLVIATFSLWLYRKYVCWNSRRLSRYYKAYRDDKRRASGR